jgi:hypothetical protein
MSWPPTLLPAASCPSLVTGAPPKPLPSPLLPLCESHRPVACIIDSHRSHLPRSSAKLHKLIADVAGHRRVRALVLVVVLSPLRHHRSWSPASAGCDDRTTLTQVHPAAGMGWQGQLDRGAEAMGRFWPTTVHFFFPFPNSFSKLKNLEISL